MLLYLVRHGYAGDADDTTDPDRPLTDDGVGIVQSLGAWMIDAKASPTAIWASPMVRTQQTARILRDVLGVSKRLVTETGLQPENRLANASLRMIVKKAADTGQKRLLMVSHHDSISAGMRTLNFMSADEFDVFAMGEMRAYDVDRKKYFWEERYRVVPSMDLGEVDYY